MIHIIAYLENFLIIGRTKEEVIQANDSFFPHAIGLHNKLGKASTESNLENIVFGHHDDKTA